MVSDQRGPLRAATEERVARSWQRVEGLTGEGRKVLHQAGCHQLVHHLRFGQPPQPNLAKAHCVAVRSMVGIDDRCRRRRQQHLTPVGKAHAARGSVEGWPEPVVVNFLGRSDVDTYVQPRQRIFDHDALD